MKKSAFMLAAVSILVFACALPSPTVEPPAATDMPASPTNTPEESAPPTEEPTAAPVTNVACGSLAFYLDPAIATGTDCATIPASGGADYAYFEIWPQHVEVTLTGYTLGARFHTPRISVYPVAEYQALVPDAINPRVSALQALIGGSAPGTDAFPLLPIFNAAQVFSAQYAVVPFQNGSGIRYITEYHQAYYSVNNHDLFFSFQGLTADGAYWVSIILPISHPSLPDISDVLNEAAAESADAYYDQKAADLNAADPDSFNPSIITLEYLVNSLIVLP